MIRPANLEDAEAIQKLNAESLGYDFELTETRKKLERLLQQEGHIILVAENAAHQVIAYVHAAGYDCLYFPSLLNLLALAVDEKFQGQGYGKELMRALGQQGKAQGYAGVRINSGVARQEAHQFYHSLGCLEKADQKRFYWGFIKNGAE